MRLGPEEETFAAVAALVATAFPDSNWLEWRAVYVDPEGDTITVTNDGELAEGLAVAASASASASGSAAAAALTLRILPKDPGPWPSTEVVVGGAGAGDPARVVDAAASRERDRERDREARDLRAALRASLGGAPEWESWTLGSVGTSRGPVGGVTTEEPYRGVPAYATTGYIPPLSRFIWRHAEYGRED